MNANALNGDSSPAGGEDVFLARDYSTLNQYWRLSAVGGAVTALKKLDHTPGTPVQGMLEVMSLGGRKTTIAFLSKASHQTVPRAPDYSRNLVVLINERLLGDGLAAPHLRFNKGLIARDFSIETDDGWSFHVRYRAPLLREALRRFNLGNTLEYDPVDFVERLIEIVANHRPNWLVPTSK